MATILNFKPAQTSARPVRPAGAEAQLILFPGIRYERQAQATAIVKQGRGGAAPDRAKPRF